MEVNNNAYIASELKKKNLIIKKPVLINFLHIALNGHYSVHKQYCFCT